MRTRFTFRLMGILAVTFLLSACGLLGGDGETENPAVPGQATVTGLEVFILESFPVQVQAIVAGEVPNSCMSVTGVGVQQQDLTFLLDVQTFYTDNGACVEGPASFTQPVSLNVENAPAGTYTVIAGQFSQQFTLTVDNVAQPPPAEAGRAGGTNLTTNVNTALAGQAVTLNGQGFTPNETLNIGIGIQGGGATPLGQLQANSDGNFSVDLNLPGTANAGEYWVFSTTLNGVPVYTNPILIVPVQTSGPETTEPSQPAETAVNTVTNGTISRTNLYFTAIGDNGQNGQLIGCGDSILPVAISLDPPTVAPMTAAYNRLFTIKDQNYGNYYNALYQSNLTLDSITIVGRGFVQINLSGNIVLAGECDSPRVLAQLEQVALQYNTVNGVRIYLNDQMLTERVKPGGLG